MRAKQYPHQSLIVLRDAEVQQAENRLVQAITQAQAAGERLEQANNEYQNGVRELDTLDQEQRELDMEGRRVVDMQRGRDAVDRKKTAVDMLKKHVERCENDSKAAERAIINAQDALAKTKASRDAIERDKERWLAAQRVAREEAEQEQAEEIIQAKRMSKNDN